MTSLDYIYEIESLDDVSDLSLTATPTSVNACTSLQLVYQCRSNAQDYSSLSPKYPPLIPPLIPTPPLEYPLLLRDPVLMKQGQTRFPRLARANKVPRDVLKGSFKLDCLRSSLTATLVGLPRNGSNPLLPLAGFAGSRSEGYESGGGDCAHRSDLRVDNDRSGTPYIRRPSWIIPGNCSAQHPQHGKELYRANTALQSYYLSPSLYVLPVPGDRTTKLVDMTSLDYIYEIESLDDVSDLSLTATPTSVNACTSLQLVYQCRSNAQDYSVAVAIVLIVVIYVLIMTEVVHRTSAALLGSSLGIAALSILNMRPDLGLIISWIDWETLGLLMGMMIMVSLLADSGFFDWAAVKVYELSKGRIYVLVTLLNIITAVLSAFLDNVTTILLISPVTITLCQVMHLDPTKVLLSLVMFSNIGGAATGIGDPPNVLIINAGYVKDSLGFSTFTIHMCIGSIVCLVAAFAYTWFIHKGENLVIQNSEVEELLREAELWQRIADRSYMGTTEEVRVKELLNCKASRVKRLAQERLVTPTTATSTYSVNLPKLREKALSYSFEENYPVDNFQTIEVAVAIVLIVVIYVLIMTEVVHRTSAALLGSSLGIAALSILNMRPDLGLIISWIDWETLGLLMGMMIMVSLLADSGFFDWAAVKVYELSKGRIYVLVTLLNIITAVLSAFLDNVTTILLISPVTITLCQVMHLDPTKVLLSLVMFSNIGGAATGIGDPPNVLIINAGYVKDSLGFSTFTIHMCIGSIFCLVAAFAYTWFIHKGENLVIQNSEVEELLREAELWQRIADRSYMGTTEEVRVKELLNCKASRVKRLAQERLVTPTTATSTYSVNLPKLREKYGIRDKGKLIKTAIVLVICIFLFFIYTLPYIHTTPGEIAMAGAIALIIFVGE
eukprot:sb/3461887/